MQNKLVVLLLLSQSVDASANKGLPVLGAPVAEGEAHST
jgi:hypothetical protein